MLCLTAPEVFRGHLVYRTRWAPSWRWDVVLTFEVKSSNNQQKLRLDTKRWFQCFVRDCLG